MAMISEAEWLGGNDLAGMLDLFARKGDDRSMRLFACGCIRDLGHLLVEPRARKAFLSVERYAAGLADQAELQLAHLEAKRALQHLHGPHFDRNSVTWEVFSRLITVHEALVLASTSRADPWVIVHATSQRLLQTPLHERSWWARVNKGQCDLLRDLLGNPFRRVKLPVVWLRGQGRDAVLLAQTIDHERSHDEMPVLGDALIDADCPEPAMVRHCQEAGGSHGRGCWVIDRLLRRTGRR